MKRLKPFQKLFFPSITSMSRLVNIFRVSLFPCSVYFIYLFIYFRSSTDPAFNFAIKTNRSFVLWLVENCCSGHHTSRSLNRTDMTRYIFSKSSILAFSIVMFNDRVVHSSTKVYEHLEFMSSTRHSTAVQVSSLLIYYWTRHKWR